MKYGYNNLAELLLNQVRKRPAMYLGRNHISCLPNFIYGFMMRDCIAQGEHDPFFGDRGFQNWYDATHKPAPRSFWHEYFLEAANNDEVAALELYFERVAEWHTWYLAGNAAGHGSSHD